VSPTPSSVRTSLTHEAFGRIDVLVTNAHTALPVVSFADSNLEHWRNAMEVNLWGSLNMSQAVVPYTRNLGDGRMIMTLCHPSR
jgi:NADP-dependent 3-hydroxy acid dehydrogenase YdfG